MTPLQIRFLFPNLGHFATHFLMLVFATVVALMIFCVVLFLPETRSAGAA